VRSVLLSLKAEDSAGSATADRTAEWRDVKVLFFHLMPYGALPDDFSSKYNSVWVDIDSDLFKHEDAHRMYHEYLDQLQFADELGFDGVCVNEHHANGYALMSTRRGRHPGHLDRLL
jgi:hypothetical protein